MAKNKFFTDALDNFIVAAEPVIEKVFNLRLSEISSTSRTKDLIRSQQMVIGGARSICGKHASSPDIGLAFGGLSKRKVEDRIRTHRRMLKDDLAYKEQSLNFINAVKDQIREKKKGPD